MASRSVVYFVRLESGSIKIGTTSRGIKERVSYLRLQFGTPIEVLAIHPGDRRTELRIHEQFSHLRFPGTEQFRPAPDLMEFVGRPDLAAADYDSIRCQPESCLQEPDGKAPFGRHNSGPSRRGHRSHGMSKSPEFGVLSCMKQRCYNSRDIGFRNYGARGIRVCDRWLDSFQSFYEDMGQRPSAGHSLDRIDRNGDYSPENCRWSTAEEQNNNKRSNVIIEHEGQRMTLAQWSMELGIKYGTLHRRYTKSLARGSDVAAVLTRPLNDGRGRKLCHSAKAR